MDKIWPLHLFEYYHDGSWYCFEIRARSAEEARERVNKLPLSKYLGEIQGSVPGAHGMVCPFEMSMEKFLAVGLSISTYSRKISTLGRTGCAQPN